MDYRCRLGSLGNSSTAAVSSVPGGGDGSPELLFGRPDFFFFVPFILSIERVTIALSSKGENYLQNSFPIISTIVFV